MAHMLYCHIPEIQQGRNVMETKVPKPTIDRAPILTDMLEQLSGQTDNPILNSSPAVKEIRSKEKDKK